jgi:GNAT superfamily N-acetyltransferase
MANITIREARKEDVSIILDFIKQLALYEKEPQSVEATEEILTKSIFVEHSAHCVFVCEGENKVGFALYFYNFSTWKGKKGLYLEDLFVLEEYRHKGYGKALLSYLAAKAIKEDCGRFEWIVLDWNAPSIAVYKSIGAKPMSDWTVFRLEGKELSLFAKENKY